ncbi:hypothetical protein [Methylobacterium sp. Gmos1]
MFSLSAIGTYLAGLIARTAGEAAVNAFIRWVDGMRAAEAQREVGAAQQHASSRAEAERQEAAARAAADATAAAPEDPADPFKRD